MQTRDLYIPAGDVGFWQGAIREADDPVYAALRKDIVDARPFTIEVLYGDHEGGQRTITRFGMIPAGTQTGRSGSPRWPATGTSTVRTRASGDGSARPRAGGMGREIA